MNDNTPNGPEKDPKERESPGQSGEPKPGKDLETGRSERTEPPSSTNQSKNSRGRKRRAKPIHRKGNGQSGADKTPNKRITNTSTNRTRSAHVNKEKRTDWGQVAGWYDQLVADEGSDYQQQVVFPGAIRLLGLKPGLKVLDVGCGQGAFCRLLHEMGASTTGTDAAAAMIRLAKHRSDPAIRYLVAPAEKLGEVAHLRGAFGAAACVLAIQNMDPLAPVMAHIAHCLQPAGRLVIVMMHPAFRGPKHTHWGWDDHEVQYRRVDRYLLPRKHPIYTHPGSDPTRYTWTFHRPLQAYFRALTAAGLVVDALEEWPSHKQSTSGPRAKAENTARREIPMFLALRAVKPPPADLAPPPTVEDHP